MHSLLLAHVSDPHASVGGPLYGTVDGIDRLDLVGLSLREMGVNPDAVIVAGDLVQSGHTEAYTDVAAALTRLEASTGAPVLIVPGNHDHPLAFLTLPQSTGVNRRIAYVGQTRLALLDSSTGSLGSTQLEWLAGELSEPHGDGTVLVLHHPPTPSPLVALAGRELSDADELAAVIAASDVRMILAGHFHHSLSAQLGSVPISVSPALSYQQDPTAAPESVRGVDSPAYSLVHLTDRGHSVVSVALRPSEVLFNSHSRHITAVSHLN
ncbi:3',5'-cyclic AMP phosphodiesterase CpdA [Rhodoglobus vestalii]|uniref:3',5'-cyclic AMP phosphodiesterase CpdA n=1 Tax=Rhodoglobus vestalii TaxID=193384 RepID=A0A8H2PZP4_9MICO|nr:metallophosphoesterase [Rhodoglobus vestalii]TQO20888.1 3',5'-cyclic AMP phosphodiesterase CpdA [Rhodoglobus vestalii]